MTETATQAGPAGQEGSPGARVELAGIVKVYGETRAVDDVSLTVEPGQFLTLLGASGSGKTTLLRIIAGFVDADEGRIVVNGRDISQVPVHQRGIGMVFQNYALFPHLSVAANVGFPLEMRGVRRRDRGAMVERALEAVHLGGYGRRSPKELSGGQQQRVALARAIVARPPLLLMDEPLGALDRRLREAMQIEIRRLSRELGLTVINVTHDQEEALTMSDRIALLAGGRLVQHGTPEELYGLPESEVAARFLGESNLFRGRVRREGADSVLALPYGRVLVPGDTPGEREAVVVVRPSAIRIRPAGAEPSASVSRMPGVVSADIYAGDSRKVLVAGADGAELVVRCESGAPLPCSVGDEVVLEWDPGSCHIIPGAA
ncbi:ABC transporter ATP-binding protein [Microbispora amethystogenes]|uniref:ABC transporter ATP-binding protein n=1 Tax=Microbispora amethystogenes TaxID=1427754 RepID=UPI0033F9A3CA